MQGMKTLNNIKKIWGAALIGIASFMLQGCQEAAQKGDGLLMTGTSSDRLVKFAIDGFPSAYAVSVTSTSRVELPPPGRWRRWSIYWRLRRR